MSSMASLDGMNVIELMFALSVLAHIMPSSCATCLYVQRERSLGVFIQTIPSITLGPFQQIDSPPE